MKYSLYIDESGDFETPRGEWVLAGLLFSESYDQCENIFAKKLNPFPKKIGLHSIKEFHLTEFRRDLGHDKALDIAEKLYTQLDALPFNYYGIAAINYTKATLSEREKTYRLMLSDLIALCETAIPDDQEISRLDIVVASRTINGIKQTTISDIHHDILGTLPSALEIDLATKGLLDIMGKNIKVHMDYANQSWGLVSADFLANINYHYRKNNEQNLLNKLKKAGKFYSFESFGGIKVRRARVAERNKDYPAAIQRWIDIAIETEINQTTDSAILGLLGKLFLKMGTTGANIAFESLLDLLWRANNSPDRYQALSAKLHYLDCCLDHFIKRSNSSKYDSLTFRLRNLMLIVFNHLGQVHEAIKLIKIQKAHVSNLATNPELFHLILNFKISETEVYINSLDLKSAFDLALEYSELIENYKGLWQLLLSDEDVERFDTSFAFIKSEMSLFRIFALSMRVINTSSFEFSDDRLKKLHEVISHPLDKSRLNNYQVMYYLKKRMHQKALSLMMNRYTDSGAHWSTHDFHWFLRTVNASLISSIEIDTKSIKEVINEQTSKFDLNLKGHPIDLVLRELALFEFQTGNTSKAKKLIARSIASIGTADSEIFKFLTEVAKIHEDYIFGRQASNSSYFQEMSNSITKAIFEEDTGMSFLEKVRHFSIY